MSTPEHDEQLRRRLRAARRAIRGAARAGAERAIVETLLGLDELAGAVAVGWSSPTDGEVDLTGAVGPLLERGATLWLPVVGPAAAGTGPASAEPSMRFARYSPGDPLVANRHGIDEPTEDAPRCDARDLGVVVVPSVAVDHAGNRLGFGAGYYDRALAARGDATTVATVFEAQLVGSLDPDPWDVPLDIVVTEARVLRR